MQNNKQYSCEIPECGRLVNIRSTVKTGELKGKKCCGICKQKLEGKKKVQKLVVKQTKKNLEKRKTERQGLPEYFSEAIAALVSLYPNCQNCGGKIKTWLLPHNNIAHILKKSHYKSVMSNPYNRVFLCDSKDNPETGKSCHYEFDNKITERPFMVVFDIVMVKYRLFKDDVLETGKEKLILDNEL